MFGFFVVILFWSDEPKIKVGHSATGRIALGGN